MVLIPTGTFLMGLDSASLDRDMQRFNLPADSFLHEYPAIRVTVPAFYMDKYDVTNSDYKKFIEANPYWQKGHLPDSLQDGNYLKNWKGNKYPKGEGDFPVTYVSWYAAATYAHWVGKWIPTESEWEYAARQGGQNTPTFAWGDADASPGKANYGATANAHAVKVGSYPANSLGIYDMAGNIRHFCADRWRPDMYAKAAQFAKNRRPPMFLTLMTPAQLKTVSIRGASWNDPAEKLRVTYRDGWPINKCAASVGFRCAANGLNSRR